MLCSPLRVVPAPTVRRNQLRRLLPGSSTSVSSSVPLLDTDMALAELIELLHVRTVDAVEFTPPQKMCRRGLAMKGAGGASAGADGCTSASPSGRGDRSPERDALLGEHRDVDLGGRGGRREDGCEGSRWMEGEDGGGRGGSRGDRGVSTCLGEEEAEGGRGDAGEEMAVRSRAAGASFRGGGLRDHIPLCDCPSLSHESAASRCLRLMGNLGAGSSASDPDSSSVSSDTTTDSITGGKPAVAEASPLAHRTSTGSAHVVAGGGGGVGGGNSGHAASPPTLADETEDSRPSRSNSSPKESLPCTLPSLATLDLGSSRSRGRSGGGPAVDPALGSPLFGFEAPTMTRACVVGAAGDSDHQGADEDAMLTIDALLAWSAPPTRRPTSPPPPSPPP